MVTQRWGAALNACCEEPGTAARRCQSQGHAAPMVAPLPRSLVTSPVCRAPGAQPALGSLAGIHGRKGTCINSLKKKKKETKATTEQCRSTRRSPEVVRDPLRATIFGAGGEPTDLSATCSTLARRALGQRKQCGGASEGKAGHAAHRGGGVSFRGWESPSSGSPRRAVTRLRVTGRPPRHEDPLGLVGSPASLGDGWPSSPQHVRFCLDLTGLFRSGAPDHPI